MHQCTQKVNKLEIGPGSSEGRFVMVFGSREKANPVTGVNYRLSLFARDEKYSKNHRNWYPEKASVATARLRFMEPFCRGTIFIFTGSFDG